MRRQIEADQVPPRPLVQADADTRGVVAVRHARVPSAREGAPGTRVVGRGWDPVRGRRPRYRRAEGVAQPDTARLWGTVRPAPAGNEATVGRRRARLEASDPMRRCPAGAGRAETRWGWDPRPGHGDPTCRRVDGEDARPEDRAGPGPIPPGERQETRPDRTPVVLAPWGVERAGPLGGEPHDGHALDQPVPPTRVATRAPCLAPPGVAPGASTAVAAAALGPEEMRAARGDPGGSSRVPATARAGGRRLPAAVAPDAWAEGGALAQTTPPTKRPGPVVHGEAGAVTREAPPDRAVVVPSSAPEQRRL